MDLHINISQMPRTGAKDLTLYIVIYDGYLFKHCDNGVAYTG